MAQKRTRSLRTTSGEHEFLRFKLQPQYDEDERKKLIRDLEAIKGRHVEIGRTLDWDFLHSIQAAGHILRYFERGPSVPDSELSSMAWKAALDLREPIYRELTLEFIATYSFDEDRGRECETVLYYISFGWPMYLAQFAISLRLYTAGMVGTDYFEYYIGQCALAPPEGLDYSELWSQLGQGPYRRSNTKSGNLVDPEHRVLHRMIAYTLNQRKSSQDKIGDFELWLLHQLVSRDRHTHLAFIIADFLTGARGFRTSSGLLGSHYITRLASSHGILTPEVIALLTCLGELGRIDQNQLMGMRVIERGVGSSWVWIGVRVEPEDQEIHEPQQPQHQQQQDEARPSGSHQMSSDWDAYTAFQGLSSRTHYHDTQIHRSLNWQNQSLMGFFTNPEFRPSAPPYCSDLVCRPSNQLYELDFSSSSELQFP
ncbi:hypothetical protein OSB04_006896 [Centaurea solstitialis]|uniref:Uncharacterized protein n=1 Tax=Centaurea solstitialis TaxID=347529 RepID=A0AA38TWN4_9ASTR|nr:hypothetical protein OSB04_006896 [Centaurea solstitialis]